MENINGSLSSVCKTPEEVLGSGDFLTFFMLVKNKHGIDDNELGEDAVSNFLTGEYDRISKAEKILLTDLIGDDEFVAKAKRVWSNLGTNRDVVILDGIQGTDLDELIGTLKFMKMVISEEEGFQVILDEVRSRVEKIT